LNPQNFHSFTVACDIATLEKVPGVARSCSTLEKVPGVARICFFRHFLLHCSCFSWAKSKEALHGIKKKMPFFSSLSF
jgi:hypothetical protein